MARRQDHSREELHALALSAARELALKDGLKGVTIRAIASRIGYSVGTLYNIFEDQSDLIVQLNGSVLDDLYKYMEKVPQGDLPQEYLLDLASAYLAFTQDNDKLWSLLFEHRLPDGRDLPDWYQKKLSQLLGLVERGLLDALPPGNEGLAHDMSRILWASLHGIATLSQTGKLGTVTASTAEDMAHALVRDYLTGVATRLHTS